MASHAKEIRRQLEESARVKQSFSNELVSRIVRFSEKSAAVLRSGGKLVFFGNGGSASDALHLAAELVVRLRTERKSLAAFALTTNPSVLTAAGNDYGFEQIYSRQIESMVASQDVLVALSTSGNSPNILKAVEWANAHDLNTWGITGYDGGKLMNLARNRLHIPLHDMGMVESIHLVLFHWVLNDMYARINRVGRHADGTRPAPKHVFEGN